MTALALILCTATMPPLPRVILPEAMPELAKAEELTDPVKLAERIAKTSHAAGEKLAAEQAGTETQQDQFQVKNDLDALIKLLENQPPPPRSSSSSNSKSDSPPPPPKGGESTGKGSSPMSKGSPSESKPMPKNSENNRGESKPMGATPKEPKSESTGADAKPGSANQAGKGGTSKASLPLEESLARDFWGHLPDASRQRMMQFFREQYMPKYKDLLGEYYQSLAEKEKKTAK